MVRMSNSVSKLIGKEAKRGPVKAPAKAGKAPSSTGRRKKRKDRDSDDQVCCHMLCACVLCVCDSVFDRIVTLLVTVDCSL